MSAVCLTALDYCPIRRERDDSVIICQTTTISGIAINYIVTVCHYIHISREADDRNGRNVNFSRYPARNTIADVSTN